MKRRDVKMLRVQVLGSGLIPRGHGIAPKKEPFPADLRLIGLIISTAGLKINFVHPESGNLVELTRDNYQTMYKKYANKVYKKSEVEEKKKEAAPLNPENPATDENNGGPVIPTPAPVVTPPVVPAAPAPVVDPVVPPVVVPTTPEVTSVVNPAEADKAPEAAVEKKDESGEFTMKPIASPEENKNKGNQNNNNNRGQNNNNRK